MSAPTRAMMATLGLLATILGRLRVLPNHRQVMRSVRGLGVVNIFTRRMSQIYLLCRASLSLQLIQTMLCPRSLTTCPRSSILSTAVSCLLWVVLQITIPCFVHLCLQHTRTSSTSEILSTTIPPRHRRCDYVAHCLSCALPLLPGDGGTCRGPLGRSREIPTCCSSQFTASRWHETKEQSNLIMR